MYIFEILGGREHFQTLVYVKIIGIIIYKSIKIHIKIFLTKLLDAPAFMSNRRGRENKKISFIFIILTYLCIYIVFILFFLLHHIFIIF